MEKIKPTWFRKRHYVYFPRLFCLSLTRCWQQSRRPGRSLFQLEPEAKNQEKAEEDEEEIKQACTEKASRKRMPRTAKLGIKNRASLAFWVLLLLLLNWLSALSLSPSFVRSFSVFHICLCVRLACSNPRVSIAMYILTGFTAGKNQN